MVYEPRGPEGQLLQDPNIWAELLAKIEKEKNTATEKQEAVHASKARGCPVAPLWTYGLLFVIDITGEKRSNINNKR